jgi:hypothetical protein
MSAAQATAEVFWTAFRSLPVDQRQAVLRRLVEDDALRQDLLDLATIAERRREPARPLRKYLKVAR